MRLAHMDVHEGLTDRWDNISGGWGGGQHKPMEMGGEGEEEKKSMGGGEPGL